MNIRARCSRWIFSLNVLDECSLKMFALNVLDEYSFKCWKWELSMNIRVRYSRWIFALNVCVECSRRMFIENVLNEYSLKMFALNIRVKCLRWMFSINIHLNVENENYQWMFIENVRVRCSRWIFALNVLNECSQINIENVFSQWVFMMNIRNNVTRMKSHFFSFIIKVLSFVKLNDDERLTLFYFILLTRFVLCIIFCTYKSTKSISQKILICDKLWSNQCLTLFDIELIHVLFDTTRSFFFWTRELVRWNIFLFFISFTKLLFSLCCISFDCFDNDIRIWSINLFRLLYNEIFFFVFCVERVLFFHLFLLSSVSN